MTNKILTVALLFVFAFTACTSEKATEKTANKPGDGYLADDNLNTEMPSYSTVAAGQSETIERAFQDAPPMIPHALTGLLPITMKSNMCLSCHMPAVAAAVKAVPLPVSHLTSFRPEVKKNGAIYEVVNNEGVTKEDLDGKLSMAIYNCTLCHAPQADVTVDIKNRFEAVFKSTDGKSKSTLMDNYSEGVE